MFNKASAQGYQEIRDGVELKTHVHGQRTHLTTVRFKKGGIVPTHQHPHEQTGCVLSGSLRFIVENEPTVVHAGDSWNIPSNVPHSAEALEESVVIEVFSPPREDYLRLSN